MFKQFINRLTVRNNFIKISKSDVSKYHTSDILKCRFNFEKPVDYTLENAKEILIKAMEDNKNFTELERQIAVQYNLVTPVFNSHETTYSSINHRSCLDIKESFHITKLRIQIQIEKDQSESLLYL